MKKKDYYLNLGRLSLKIPNRRLTVRNVWVFPEIQLYERVLEFTNTPYSPYSRPNFPRKIKIFNVTTSCSYIHLNT